MTWERVLSIALAVALANLVRAYLTKYKAWKAARTVIPAHQNWRGDYVPDLWLKRMERAVIWAWVLVTIAAFPIAYLHLKTIY